ncbi:helix-turn-helix transcriptional regulator [Serratia aquatilis]|uniref:Helix-turn-helix transcriptional regulator n=1 Tax=Serratia aquatilis TaxID=1737515 RepID=A0ABV6EB52_9GAMM
MNIRKSAFIQHSCMYTREGIKLTLANLIDNNIDVKVVADESYLETKAFRLLYNKSVDVFILGLQGTGDSHGSILDFILQWLPMHYPEAKVVVMTQTRSIGQLKNYLLGLENVAAVLDDSIEISELQTHLQHIMMNSPQVGTIKKPVTPLTHQEIKVLGHLLKGVPVLKIASTLRINQKTVSAHKRAAMNKLGISSLHGLIRCQVNLSMMSDLLTLDKTV